MSESDASPPGIPSESWKSPQTIIGVGALLIVAATIAGVFWIGDKAMIGQTSGGVLGLGGVVIGFYFQTAASSQRKDRTIADLAARKDA